MHGAERRSAELLQEQGRARQSAVTPVAVDVRRAGSSVDPARRFSPTPWGTAATRPEQTFHEFASEWMAAKRAELRENSAADYEWAITVHLLPHFARLKLGEITIQEVDRYRSAKAREGSLSPPTINKTLTRLASILEDAVEYGLIEKNPAKGRRRRLKVDPARPVYLDTGLRSRRCSKPLPIRTPTSSRVRRDAGP